VTRFDAYRESFPNALLTRSGMGVLEVALHTDGGTLVFDGHTHEQFVDLFHAIGSDSDNRVVILTGSGDAFMERITLDGFDFFYPAGLRQNLPRGQKGPDEPPRHRDAAEAGQTDRARIRQLRSAKDV
jgi:enoyl-CoA hydratase/carnithine racemase